MQLVGLLGGVSKPTRNVNLHKAEQNKKKQTNILQRDSNPQSRGYAPDREARENFTFKKI
jgi:hypothetical protein